MRKAKHKTKPTSILAYCDILENLGERQIEVYRAILDLKSCNSTMISKHLDLKISSVTGRVHELRQYGIVMQEKKDLCPYTKKLTIFWKVRRRL